MTQTITADLSRMFSRYEPWDVSNSVANLGERAGELTWQCALEIAADHKRWLHTPLLDACLAMQEWARRTGAWEQADIDLWPAFTPLALFVQNVASELRMLGSDDCELGECVDTYDRAAAGGKAPASELTGHYYFADDEAESLRVDYYTGM